jgi:hypothetical protein
MIERNQAGFAFLNSILENKKNRLKDGTLLVKQYNPNWINRGLSQHRDCILYADEMNMLPDLPPDMQYDYYLGTIAPRQRSYGKWASKTEEDEITALVAWFRVPPRRAREIRKVLRHELVKTILEKVEASRD